MKLKCYREMRRDGAYEKNDLSCTDPSFWYCSVILIVKQGSGCCKHVAAALYQLIDFKMCEVKSIPDDKTCTDILQQWNIPGEQKQTNAVPFENLNFERHRIQLPYTTLYT